MLVKICGATTHRDLRVLAAAGANLVGLWHDVGAVRAELTLPALSDLASADGFGGDMRPVLVTFSGDVERLLDVVAATGVRWLQLHGYQPPGVVAVLKERGPADLVVVKVLHVAASGCVERPLIRSYERAGVDLFLLDAATEDGRIGSTGERLASQAICDLAGDLSRPFLLAGGISAECRPDYSMVVEHPLFAGIDVDSAARDALGRLQSNLVAAIVQTWQTDHAAPAGAAGVTVTGV